MTRILIIDDHAIVREGMRILIGDFYPKAELLEAHNESSALEQLKLQSFDMVILDVQMPASNSFALLNFIKTQHRSAKVLVFSMGSETLYGKRFIKAGADGYLSKEASRAEIKKALETIAVGKKYLSESLMQALLSDYSDNENKSPFSRLSQREFEITDLMLAGLTVTQIAERTNLQVSTIGTYKTRIFEKLQVTNILQLKELASAYQI